jgi:hydroxypyruvate reductase
MATVLQLGRLPVDDDYIEPSDLPLLTVELNDAPAWAEAHGGDVVAVVTTAGKGLPDAVWRRLPNLKLISSFGAGQDLFDPERMAATGVRLFNTPEVVTEDVADLAMLLILNLLRESRTAEDLVRSGAWATEKPALARSLTGRRVGVFGMGRIGAAFARRAEACRMEIGYHNRRQKADLAYPYFPDLAGLAAWSDILVVAAPASPQTHHAVDAQVLRALGPAGWVINVSRGALIDEAALLEALNTGGVAGAGLDVYEGEPRINPAYLTAPNTVLLPHVGSSTVETRRAGADLVYDAVRALLAG